MLAGDAEAARSLGREPLARIASSGVSGDLVHVELNEAFAIGHPLGASGARVRGHLAHALRSRGGRGLAAIWTGVGLGLAVVLEA